MMLMSWYLREAFMPCIAVERLARTAIKTALHGGQGLSILENADCLGEGELIILGSLMIWSMLILAQDWAMVNSIS